MGGAAGVSRREADADREGSTDVTQGQLAGRSDGESTGHDTHERGAGGTGSTQSGEGKDWSGETDGRDTLSHVQTAPSS